MINSYEIMKGGKDISGDSDNTLLYFIIAVLLLCLFSMSIGGAYFYYKYTLEQTSVNAESKINVDYDESISTPTPTPTPASAPPKPSDVRFGETINDPRCPALACNKSINGLCTFSCIKDSKGVLVIVKGPQNTMKKDWIEDSKTSACGKSSCKKSYCLSSCITRPDGAVVKTYKFNPLK
jgi:hypothetical protein